MAASSTVYPAAEFAPDLAMKGVPVAEFNLEATTVTSQLKYARSLHLHVATYIITTFTLSDFTFKENVEKYYLRLLRNMKQSQNFYKPLAKLYPYNYSCYIATINLTFVDVRKRKQ